MAKAKGRDSTVSKATQLAMAVRRMQVRRRQAEAAEDARMEARKQARHERALVRKEGTGKLAKARIEAIQRHPSPVGLAQLAKIAGDPRTPASQRVKAASKILHMGD